VTELARLVSFTLHKHPNADRLSIAKIDGTDWQCVTATDQWHGATSGQAVYIAIDALLDPTRPYFDFLKDKATKKFADGRPGHRLKTVRLRGALSQGMIIPVPDDEAAKLGDFPHNIDWTAALGIERYEPPIPAELRGDMVREPGAFARYTKIENAKNFPDLFAEGETVRVTEKIHGTNFRVGLVFDGTDGGPRYMVGTHGTARDPNGTNLYSMMARKFLPEAGFRAAIAKVGPEGACWFKEHCIVFAEIYGHKVQDLHYGCKANEQQVRVFDVLVDHQYQSWESVQYVARLLGLETAPLLHEGPFEKEKVLALRDGASTLPDTTHVREGVVVTAMPEARVDDPATGFQGRKILKYISDAYLERKDARDGH
jgi:RNA ligase (TIGR02306 family)